MSALPEKHLPDSRTHTRAQPRPRHGPTTRTGTGKRSGNTGGPEEELSDAQLVATYVAGDHRAFATIITRHERHLKWAARKYGRNEEDAHDILQEALLKASRNMHLYRAEAALSTWLHKLVLNSGFDWARHRSRRELSILDDTPTTPAEDPRLSVDPLGYLDVALTIRQAMDQLHPDQRNALLLVDLGGYGIEDVAHYEGVRPGTIKSRRARAKAQLRILLREDFFAGRDATPNTAAHLPADTAEEAPA